MNHETQLRKNFFITAELSEKAEVLAKEINMNFSQFIRAALNEYIKKIEQENIEREAIEACEIYYDLDKKIAEEWRSAEGSL